MGTRACQTHLKSSALLRCTSSHGQRRAPTSRPATQKFHATCWHQTHGSVFAGGTASVGRARSQDQVGGGRVPGAEEATHMTSFCFATSGTSMVMAVSLPRPAPQQMSSVGLGRSRGRAHQFILRALSSLLLLWTVEPVVGTDVLQWNLYCTASVFAHMIIEKKLGSTLQFATRVRGLNLNETASGIHTEP